MTPRWPYRDGIHTQFRGDRGYNKLAAPSDHPPCRQLVNSTPFAQDGQPCGKPSAYTIRRPGYVDFWLCEEHGENWR